MVQGSEVSALNGGVAEAHKDRWWYLAIAALGVAWNAFGITQFLGSINATPDSLMADGLNSAQALAYSGLPAWMDFAFALGVFGGLAGALALALRSRSAVYFLGASLVGYVALFAGDFGYGLFDLMPAQLPVLSFVLAVSGLMLYAARTASRRQWLR